MYAVYDCTEFPTEQVKFTNLKLYKGQEQVIPEWTTFQGQQPPICSEAIEVQSTEEIVISF